MKFLKDNNIYRLFNFLSSRRKKEVFLILILIILNSVAESFSLFSLIPFLSIIASPESIKTIPFFGPLFDYLGLNNESQSFFIIIFFCMGVLLSTLFKVLNNWLIIRVSAKINIDLSYLIFRNNINQSYSSYLNKKSSDIISLIIEKSAIASSAISGALNLLAGTFLSTIIILSLLIYNSKITLVGIILLSIYYYFISKLVKNSLLFNGQIVAINDPKKIKVIQETFFGFRDLKINGTQDTFIKLFNKYHSLSRLSEANSEFKFSSPRSLLEGIVLFSVAIVIFNFSSVDNTSIIITIGTFIYAFQKLLPQIQMIYTSWAGLKSKFESIKIVLEELESCKMNYQISPKNNIKFKQNIIFKDVFYSYGRKNNSKFVLKNLNLTLTKGQHIGVFGETGSGKSTFLDILMGLLPVKKGKLLIDNEDIFAKNSLIKWTLNFAHVPQSVFLSDATIAENIAFGQALNEINMENLKKASKIAHIYDFIKGTKKGFYTVVGERGAKLSGGQRQRIAIARAIYQNKEILVLDEATSALDENTEKNIMISICENCKGMTIIMVTHRISSLKHCDRIFEVKENNITEQ